VVCLQLEPSICIDDDGLEALASHCGKTLQDLRLASNVCHRGLLAVARHCSQLRRLDFPHNDCSMYPADELITFETLRAVAEGCRQMQAVRVFYPCLWPRGVRRTRAEARSGWDCWVKLIIDCWHELEELVLHCEDKNETECRPSMFDFPYAEWDADYGLPELAPQLSVLLAHCPQLHMVHVLAPEETGDEGPPVLQRTLRHRFPGAHVVVSM
jgi:hypothetical protein